ncbi:MAG: hypothetical protein K6G90_05210 [Clostridia bacterium]|nr:hypothetical protein [Clostridia bacterium]
MTGRKQHLHNRITYFFVVILLIAMVFNQIGSTCASALDDGSTSLSTVCVGADGKKYQIMAPYGADSGIPDDAALSAAAIAEDDAYYDSYASRACDILGYGANDENVVRLFDISITDKNDSSVKYQPAEGSTVEVKVRLASSPETDLGVVHFGNEPEILPSEVTGRTISFETTGFSVYALVDLPEVIEDRFVSDASEFDRQPLYLSATVDSKTYYISSGIVYDSRNRYYVIARTPENSTSGAVPYYFEKISGTDNQYYMTSYSKKGRYCSTLRTGVGVQSLIVRDTDGNIIDTGLLDITFEDIDDNDRLWTVAVDESEGGDYVFSVQAQNDGLVSGDALQVAVTVEGTVDGTVTQNNAVKAAEWKGFFEKVRSSLMMIVDVIKKIVSFFGVEFD